MGIRQLVREHVAGVNHNTHLNPNSTLYMPGVRRRDRG
jgi:hypothetical protein